MKKFQIIIFLAIGIVIASGLAYSVLTPSAPVTTIKTGKNNPPKISLLYPKGGEDLSGIVEISWFAADRDKDDLTIRIQYTPDPVPWCTSCPPQKWHDITVDESNDGVFQWDTSMLGNGDYMIKVVASDGRYDSLDISGWITISNK